MIIIFNSIGRNLSQLTEAQSSKKYNKNIGLNQKENINLPILFDSKMPNYWKISGVPHKGWRLLDVDDIREDGQSGMDTNYECCMMCGHEKIRYVHIVSHDEFGEEFRVGCNCAEKMTGDYVNPERREKELRNRANRKKNWKNKQWRLSRNDNWFLNYEEHNLVIFTDKYSGKLRLKIDDLFGKNAYDNIDRAKEAAFKNVEYLKEKGNW